MIYVDKTKFIKELLDLNYTYYILHRPRRFGKTLFLSSLESLFKGEKELFKDTYIYDNWDEWEEYPILRLSMACFINSSPEKLIEGISRELDDIGNDNAINLNENDEYTDKFSDLIQELYEKNKKEVVVLIDEYDTPIVDNLNNITVASENWEILQDFYNVLKNNVNYLKFVFITGISNFNRAFLVSKFNNFKDLSFDKRFLSICGFTQEELENNYEENIKNLAKNLNMTYDEVIEKIKYFYDGYSWDGEEKVYNPISILNSLDLKSFSSFWISTGNLNFLSEIFKKNKVHTDYFQGTNLDILELYLIDLENINETSLLFQSGYLSTEKEFFQDDTIKYSLKIPNYEVEKAFRKNLLNLYIENNEKRFIENQEEIWKDLMNGKCKKLAHYLRAFITGIPHYNRVSMGKDERWKIYSRILTIWDKKSGFKLVVKKPLEDGTIDFLITKPLKEETLIISMKFTQDQLKNIYTLVNEGLKQIKDRKYYWGYSNNVKLLGLVIKDIEKDNGYITDIKCKIEEAPND
jgi:predicted CopG family antitoxin